MFLCQIFFRDLEWSARAYLPQLQHKMPSYINRIVMQSESIFCKLFVFSTFAFILLSMWTIGVLRADCQYTLQYGAADHPSKYREGCGVCSRHDFLRCTNGRMVTERCRGDKWCRQQGSCGYNCQRAVLDAYDYEKDWPTTGTKKNAQ
uniref:Uncharacterized protein n=1 Tax=Romanomermis culicivorax TaxID=13658 RepID=A0A915JKL1_ROMCU